MFTKKKKFYITTSIPYTNASPHVGFALEAIQADVLARYNRQLGKDVFFLTGTDEHGIKTLRVARELGRDPKDFADEVSVVQTRWATAALGLLRAHNGFDLAAAANDAQIAIDSDLGDLPKVEQISFLGSGWTIALAQEAGLKTREAAQFWSEAYPQFDYRHGPMSIAQKGRAVWCFGKLDPKLEQEILATGALLEKSSLDPMAHLIRAQRVAIEIAKLKGLDPDHPRGLSRSIILN